MRKTITVCVWLGLLYFSQVSIVSTSNILPDPGKCGNGNSDRIIGGRSTKIGEYPWMALVKYMKPNNTNGFHCGAVLINERYVLTAAHCIAGLNIPFDWKVSHVRLGEYDLNSDTDCFMDDCVGPEVVKDIPVEEMITHENYDPASKNQLNDIALLRLGETVSYSELVKPICLPKSESLRSMDIIGFAMDVAGWGANESYAPSTILLKAHLEVVEFNKCKETYGKHNIYLEDTQLCAGGKKGVDTCNGDSGGPLIGADLQKDSNGKRRSYSYLAGIISFGTEECGQEGYPGIYTKVSAYMDWIQTHIKV